VIKEGRFIKLPEPKQHTSLRELNWIDLDAWERKLRKDGLKERSE